MEEIKCCCKQDGCDATISILNEEDPDSYNETNTVTIEITGGTPGTQEYSASIIIDKKTLGKLIERLAGSYLKLKES